ncbi:MAG TPA: transposase [Gemmataceae bacterium]|nr:transposase [Gemmataceae bacterium]
MSQPLVIAHHLIWTAYGWWLPNDPRGSGSKTIRNEIVAELGNLHHGRKVIQPAGTTIRSFQERAAELLSHPRLTFTASALEEVGAAFRGVIDEQRYTCYACAIMPDHVHILIRKHKHQAEEMIEALKEASRQHLITVGQRSPTHPVWAGGGGWKVFLDHPDEVRRTIGYIEKNPDPLALPRQCWPFVKVYDGWPLHPGHSPNSPYARRLRDAGRYP